MNPEPAGRFEVVIERGPPRGDLYELEQKTTYRVVDRVSGRTVIAFESIMEASLSTTTGMWDDYEFTGVSGVTITPDERFVIVTYHDGYVETYPLDGPLA